MAKYEQIAKTIEQRIRHGDYQMRGFPSHAGLVEELGVNGRTVTRALTELVDQGVLVRRGTGRFDLPDEKHTKLVGMLAPSYPSYSMVRWHERLDECCSERGWALKALPYTHWHDAAIADAMSGLDGLFFHGLGDDLPAQVIEQIQAAQTPVVVLEEDVSPYGIPCVRSSRPASVQLLIQHLQEMGHQRIACVNTQAASNHIRMRIQAWQQWTNVLNVQGPLLDEPAALFSSAMAQAHRVIAKQLTQRSLNATAVVCTTAPAAVGASRAMIDAGLTPGRDVAIASMEDWIGMVQYFSPSITSLRHGRIKPLVQACLDYFEQGDSPWLGPLLLEPAGTTLFAGESTATPRHTQPHGQDNAD